MFLGRGCSCMQSLFLLGGLGMKKNILTKKPYPGRGKGIPCVYITAFAVPFFIMGAFFVLQGVYPFGSRQVLIIDAWNQYYPFLVEFGRKLKTGESLLYCWRLGLGVDFVSLAAYYLASPLNLLLVLFPENMLREAFALCC